MHRSLASAGLWLAGSLSVLFWAAPCPAQKPSAPKPNLASALAGAAPPAQGVILSADADKVELPKDAVLPGTRQTIADVAGIYGQAKQRFGAVTAIAPPTMIVLNTAPGEPNIYAGMPPLDALTLLCAGLSDTQWAALTSEQGLAVADLNTPAQRQLFAALLSKDGKLIVRPDYRADETWNDSDKRDLTDALPQAHLRLGQTISFMLPAKDQPRSYYGGGLPPPPAGAPRQYTLDDRQDYSGASDTVYGARVRAEVPNVPKQGQLDFSAPAFAALLPLGGLKTVGDLVYRIGNAAHTELYADPRLGDKTLSLRGTAAAPAADLLRALAFCVTGTYRQVGPAYVLTDDIVGVGTRRQIWAEFEHEADDLRRRPVEEAGNSIYTHHSARALSWFGDPAAYSPDEEKAQEFPIIGNGQDLLPTLERPFAKLTPAQQDIISRSVEEHNQQYKQQQATTDGTMRISPGLRVQLIVPQIITPIDMGINGSSLDQSFLWRTPREVSDAREAEFSAKQAKKHPEFEQKLPPPAPAADVFAALRTSPRRAVLVHPRTIKQVDVDIAAMQTLGLNELWLDVFSEGTAHIGRTNGTTGGSDILTEALAKTKGTGIRIFPTLSLLFWGQSPPAQDTDLNILGETSAQAAARWQQRKASLPEGQGMSEEYTTGGIIPDWDGTAVSPLAPDVRQSLLPLVRELAARPGIAGLVWRDTDVPGYDPLPGVQESSPLALGYHQVMRLAFLRKFHADPVDIIPPGAYTKANTDLPNFSMEYYTLAHGNQQLSAEWQDFRRDQNVGLLRTLYQSANSLPAKHTLVLIKQRRRGRGGSDRLGHHIYPPGWYGSWDDPRLPLPTLHSEGEDNELGKPMQPVASDEAQARTQSRLSVVPITGDELTQRRQMFAIPQGRAYFQSHPLPGFVLDLDSASDGSAPGGDTLTSLAAQSAHAAPAEVSGKKQPPSSGTVQ